MARGIEWITTSESLESALRAVGDGPLAVDTEGDSFHHYPEKVCLIQLSIGERDLLVDPLAEVDPRVAAAIFSDDKVRKILHGADYDLRVLDRDFGLRIGGLFDTMIAARLVGETAFGLAALLEKYLGVRVDKRFQRADWSQRPLPKAMQDYAVSDTRHLVELGGILERRLRELGRDDWATEEFRRMEQVRWTGAGEDPEAYLKVKRARGLTPRQLAILRELHALRERLARDRDRPPFRVFVDEALVELARRSPTRREQLSEIPRLSRSFAGGRGGREVLAAVERGMAVPEDELPRVERPSRPRPDPALDSRVKRLARRRDRLAGELGLEPSLLATKSVLTEIQRRLDEGRPADDVPDLRDWQARLLLPALDDAGA
jgi:ribonuclease D